jgi:hypothetical protein
MVDPQPTSPHQELCGCVALMEDSEFGPEGSVISKAPCWFRVVIDLGTDFLPVISTPGPSPSVLGTSPDDCSALFSVSSTLGMSAAVPVATARSRGTLGRPRNGILSEKRLAEGFKADKF